MDVQPLSSQSDSSARCPRCGGGLDCGSATRPFDCWCARLPSLRALPAQRAKAHVSSGAQDAAAAPTRCLCPACYAQALATSGASGETRGSGGVGDADCARDHSTG
ncbi:cysteine-rich CWC family protein [Trinickia sp.]|uniref:cysteine-rich CWC family protein n=1 Tax=Trinickia sp. TaxID=2571163 RepID=UPI003F8072DF